MPKSKISRIKTYSSEVERWKTIWEVKPFLRQKAKLEFVPVEYMNQEWYVQVKFEDGEVIRGKYTCATATMGGTIPDEWTGHPRAKRYIKKALKIWERALNAQLEERRDERLNEELDKTFGKVSDDPKALPETF